MSGLASEARGRVMACDAPDRYGDVLVRPGELVFDDLEGVVVAPREAEAFRLAAEKIGNEKATRPSCTRGEACATCLTNWGPLSGGKP